MCVCVFFLFKQKTAYEMRISDWSSDVCSSDLRNRDRVAGILHAGNKRSACSVEALHEFREGLLHRLLADPRSVICGTGRGFPELSGRGGQASFHVVQGRAEAGEQFIHSLAGRSEEHTSELQSLMRISYA